MFKFLKRNNKIENQLNKNVKIFGKDVKLNIIYKKINNPELNLVENSIDIYIPKKYKKNGNIKIIQLAIEKMYDEIARIEIEKVMEETRIMLNGLAPENYEIIRMKNQLSKTIDNKTIIINPEIIKYDKIFLKHTILIEFCHLKYKTKCKGFYEMIEKYSNEYKNLNVA